ncbi:MAG TPA: right-handed parallel beta-helix repeat-containing protein, partial [Herpetosiphonaceae bacterium]
PIILQMTIDDDTSIDGGSQITLTASGTRLFFVNEGVSFNLSNITLSNGDSTAGGGAIESFGADLTLRGVRLVNNAALTTGGAISCARGTEGGSLTIADSTLTANRASRGGGIFNDRCDLRVTDSSVSGNEGGGISISEDSTATLSRVTLNGNVAGHGGGIENSGNLTVADSLIASNEVTGSGGGIWNIGGSVALRRTTVRDNQAYEGGGINSYGTHVELDQVNVTGNTTEGSHGGGIFHGGGTMFISNATISDNVTISDNTHGGGIYQASDGNLAIANATVADNYADGFGGGLYHASRYATINNATFVGNAAMAGGAIYEAASPTPQNPGVIQIQNSLLADNACGGSLFESLGNNVAVAGSCAALSHGSDRLVAASAIQLDQARFNGGRFPMRTYAPLPGSAALGAGNLDTCTVTDQRGAPRDSTCDAGALQTGALLAWVWMPVVRR